MSLTVWEIVGADEVCRAVAVPLPYVDEEAGLYVYPFLAPARVSALAHVATGSVFRADAVLMVPALLVAARAEAGGPAVELLFAVDPSVHERYGLCVPLDLETHRLASRLPVPGFAAVRAAAGREDAVEKLRELAGVKNVDRLVRRPVKALYGRWWAPREAALILGGLARYLWRVVSGEGRG